LREKGIGEQVINAAIRQIFIGSALQFPYVEPDYFHELVYQRNPELKELNEGILKWFIDSATKTQRKKMKFLVLRHADPLQEQLNPEA
jgi:hypothetical protein